MRDEGSSYEGLIGQTLGHYRVLEKLGGGGMGVVYKATGRPPFSGSSSTLILDAILNRDPTPATDLNPGLPADLERILDKVLDKDREMRYQTAIDVRVDLKRLKRSLETTADHTQQMPHRTKQAHASERKATAGHIKSIAVLPLANLSRDPEQEYFEDGMTEALITDLAQIGALRGDLADLGDALQGHPRFQDLLRRMNFPA